MSIPSISIIGAMSDALDYFDKNCSASLIAKEGPLKFLNEKNLTIDQAKKWDSSLKNKDSYFSANASDKYDHNDDQKSIQDNHWDKQKVLKLIEYVDKLDNDIKRLRPVLDKGFAEFNNHKHSAETDKNESYELYMTKASIVHQFSMRYADIYKICEKAKSAVIDLSKYFK